MFQMPTSSPMMTRMFGFLPEGAALACAWAAAPEIDRPPATRIKIVDVIHPLRIFVLLRVSTNEIQTGIVAGRSHNLEIELLRAVSGDLADHRSAVLTLKD